MFIFGMFLGWCLAKSVSISYVEKEGAVEELTFKTFVKFILSAKVWGVPLEGELDHWIL